MSSLREIFFLVYSPLYYIWFIKLFEAFIQSFLRIFNFLLKKNGSIVKLSNIISSKVVFDYKVMAACIDNTKYFTKYICQYEMNIIYWCIWRVFCLFFVYGLICFVNYSYYQKIKWNKSLCWIEVSKLVKIRIRLTRRSLQKAILYNYHVEKIVIF